MNLAGGPSGQGGVFAPPGRATSAQLKVQANLCLDDATVHAVLEAVDSYAVILNAQRQILAANGEFLELLQRDAPDAVLGLRPGEALNCAHFTEGPGGCGTSEHCRTCGAVLAPRIACDQCGETVTADSVSPGL